MNYNFLADRGYAVHGSDLLPTFFTKTMDFADLLCNLPGWLAKVVKLGFQTFSSSYQSYLTSHALYGDPNAGAQHGAAQVEWPLANTSADGNHVQNVMEPYLPGFPYRLSWFRIASQDELNTRDVCSFWTAIALNIMDAQSVSQLGDLLTVQTPDSVGEL